MEITHISDSGCTCQCAYGIISQRCQKKSSKNCCQRFASGKILIMPMISNVERILHLSQDSRKTESKGWLQEITALNETRGQFSYKLKIWFCWPNAYCPWAPWLKFIYLMHFMLSDSPYLWAPCSHYIYLVSSLSILKPKRIFLMLNLFSCYMRILVFFFDSDWHCDIIE